MPVKIYTTNYCPYCRAAKDFLKSKGVAFEEIDVTGNEAARVELVEKTGQETVPQIFFGQTSIGGYEDLIRYYQSGNRL